MLKRILCYFLAALMLLSFVACSGGGDSKDTTKVPSQTTSPTTDNGLEYISDDLPVLDFGGEQVTILSAGIYNEEGEEDHKPEFTVEDLTSDAINDSIYNRELYVEDRIGVEINNIQIPESQLTDEILKMVNTGEDVYDAYIHANHTLSQYAFAGYLTDLYTVEYIDLEKPWWSQKFNDEAEFLDSLYLSTGSLSLSLLRYTYAVYYNKALVEDYKDSNPDLENLYELVNDGKWTWDKFIELGSEIYRDMNGNSQRDLEDIYGIAYDDYIPIDAIWSGFDINIFSKTSDGWYELDVNTDKLFTALDRLYVLLHENVGSITANVQNSDGTTYNTDEIEVYFANGTNLFLVAGLGSAEENTMRNMQDDYGVLPFPKYDENQKQYYSYSHDTYTAFTIPVTNQNPEVVGATLEAMASYAYRDTVPAYLDTVLKGQYMSDAESRHMIDIIVEGFMVDAAWIYLGTLASSYPNNYRYMLKDKERSYAAEHEANKKKVETVLKYYKKEMEG